MRGKKNLVKIFCLLTLCLGQVVFAPVGMAQTLPDLAAAGQAAHDFHRVESGDTYYKLSRVYQVPIDSLQRWNGPILKLGTTVRVKPEANQRPAVAGNNALDSFQSKTPAPEQTTAQSRKTAPASAPVRAGNRVAVVPFDPSLYFSDADNDIAWQSKIEKQKIRYIFQARLNALLQAPGYQTINLLSNPVNDSVYEAVSIYKHLAYSYQDIKTSLFEPVATTKEKGWKAWMKNTREKVRRSVPAAPVGVAYDQNKYYGAQIPDPNFLAALNNQTNANYYLFINQFEIFTDYSNCIDRTTQNFIRNFRVHYTILNTQGEVLAGNKIVIPYESNVNDINVIVRENLGKMASRIMADLPKPELPDTSEARN